MVGRGGDDSHGEHMATPLISRTPIGGRMVDRIPRYQHPVMVKVIGMVRHIKGHTYTYMYKK